MSNRSAWMWLIGTTVLAVFLAVGLAAVNLREAPDLRGQSTTEARAAAVESEIAAAARTALGDGWRVAAKLEEVHKYRGRFGLSAWEAQYRLTITSEDAPDFAYVTTISRSFGPGAQSADRPRMPSPQVFAAFAGMSRDQRASLLRQLAERYGAPRVAGVQALPGPAEAAGSATDSALSRAHEDVVARAKSSGVDLDTAYVVSVTAPDSIQLWGWNGTAMTPFAVFNPADGSVAPSEDSSENG